ncbi:(4Fe-4S)-binding protein [Maribellus sp. YY47]|uniref:(4Fe-4S)-binding protein n=1 Tax=Maribellus sp. YY47 TaxID=2929486 RepID=UPI002001B95B|nr:(4Fe-4S)-binding protein [Maribellus sp. YY47]MCK3685099.1 (4Fe-4S)-binding protein [Maribellus sp. YY47]
MDIKKVTKEYSNDEITVVWKSGKCIHSGNCFRNLLAVFNPGERPWIKMDKAPTSAIISTVEKCPSGALSYYYNDKK